MYTFMICFLRACTRVCAYACALMCVCACICVQACAHTHVHRANLSKRGIHICACTHNMHMHKTAKSCYAYWVLHWATCVSLRWIFQINSPGNRNRGYIMPRAPELSSRSHPQRLPKLGGGEIIMLSWHTCMEKDCNPIGWSQKLDGSAALLTHHETGNNFAPTTRFSLHSWVGWSNNYELHILLKDTTVTIIVNW